MKNQILSNLCMQHMYVINIERACGANSRNNFKCELQKNHIQNLGNSKMYLYATDCSISGVTKT